MYVFFIYVRVDVCVFSRYVFLFLVQLKPTPDDKLSRRIVPHPVAFVNGHLCKHDTI